MTSTIRSPRPHPLVRLFSLVSLTALTMLGSLMVATPSQAAAAVPSSVVAKKMTDKQYRAARIARGERVIAAARNQAGKPYRYGATGPSAFDCSGLTGWAYRVGADRKIPRTSRDQSQAVRHLAPADARRGDLVFFSSGGRVYHVGIYAGRNRYGHRTMWHSPHPGESVQKARLWTTKGVSYGRVPLSR